ncbi:MAG: glutamate-5-semialdehyde dehydrogenase [bacterium]|nr:glutamate-5-semialdehyde dehydrogenase [bacterium]MDD3804762.1 glutamate-5-semialdehyde dehydrogenase [bacterium]MDD4558026.1 glutamate-5-semialdehyde dehydrogenase [bacterium]
MITRMAQDARLAGRILGTLSGRQRTEALLTISKELEKTKNTIMAANEQDVAEAAAAGLAGPLLQRLKLSDKAFRYMTDRLAAVASLPDPLGVITKGHTGPSGLRVQRISVPLGVIGIIYESRPNVTADAAAVCIKSGNAVILRGGSEALRTNTLLADIMAGAASKAGLPEKAVQIVGTADRKAVGELLQQERLIDVIIPRGGKSLIERISAESRIPIIKHYDGICHQYIASDADIDIAVAIVVNSKCEKVEVCNALETLLVDDGAAQRVLPAVATALKAQGVKLRGCPHARAVTDMEPADEADWTTEYLASILSIKVVDGVDAAIEHINSYGSGHTDGIITTSIGLAEKFVSGVDSASVLVNASTRLSGGGDYGLGAVVGISTDKLHARGPVGPEELTTYKWIAYGQGHLRS